MDIYKSFAKSFELVKVNRSVVNKSARFAFGCYFSSDNGAGIKVEVLFLKEALELIFSYIKSGFDDTFFVFVLKGTKISPGSQSQRQSSQQDRFSSTCFSCNNSKVFLKINFQIINKCIIFNK